MKGQKRRLVFIQGLPGIRHFILFYTNPTRNLLKLRRASGRVGAQTSMMAKLPSFPVYARPPFLEGRRDLFPQSCHQRHQPFPPLVLALLLNHHFYFYGSSEPLGNMWWSLSQTSPSGGRRAPAPPQMK